MAHVSLHPNRRAFLKSGGTLALASKLVAADSPLPLVPFGKHAISRLICGSNMFGAGSHSSTYLNRRLKDYYTPERIVRTLRRSSEVGINAFQATLGMLPVYRRAVDEGVVMQFLAIANEPHEIGKLAAGGCIAIAHHGEYTDRLFKAGRIEEVNDFVKRVRDTGLLVGVSTHMPAVVDTIESKGWDLDFYMTCVYERHRTAPELKQLLGYVPLPVGEVYLQEDPPRMFKMVQQTKRTCLAFKILAAGRRCEAKDGLDAAFRETFAAIKPSDAVIVGLYDEFSDQPFENANLARKYGGGTESSRAGSNSILATGQAGL